MPVSRLVDARVCLVAAMAFLPGLVFAQAPAREFPTKPINIIIPFAPGNTDVMTRFYTQEIGRTTKWVFTFDYKPGAAGRVGTVLAIKAPADGYTMLGNSSTITYSHLLKSKPYDWRKDLAPVFQMNKTPSLLMVTASLPVNSVAEYIAYAKAYPGKINYATVGTGGIVHIVAVWMHALMGAQVTYVPYKGFGPTTSALLSGEVHATHASYLSHQANIASGKIRPLALTVPKARLKQLPQLKSMAEEGLPEFEHTVWVGLFVRGGTPTPIINRLNAEFNKAARSAEVLKKLESLGEEVGGGSPEDFRRFLSIVSERLSKVIVENNIQLED